jgi:hypothetical protein
MKIIVVLNLVLWGNFVSIISAQDQSNILFKDEKQSQIEWERLNVKEWFSFESWLKEQRLKVADPNWSDDQKELARQEIMGRVISCVGDCRVYRGEGFNRARHLSVLRELDDLQTFADSYLWVALVDGTLLRIGPKSSVSLKELNVLEDRFFLHVRANHGQIFLKNRSTATLPLSSLQETDVLFLPLRLYEANPEVFEKITENQVQRYNQWMLDNLALGIQKTTYTYIVFPNGTLQGENLETSLFTSLGGEGHFKITAQNQTSENSAILKSGALTLRGFKQTQAPDIFFDQWYTIDPAGRELAKTSESTETYRNLSLMELTYRRFPTILLANEMFIKKYSLSLFQKNLDFLSLGEDAGYRLWSLEEFQQRLNFLDSYTVKAETALLLSAQMLREKSLFRNEGEGPLQVTRDYFEKSLDEYRSQLTGQISPKGLIKSSDNLAKKKYWILSRAKGE